MEAKWYSLLCMEEKLAIDSYNKPKELLNQRSEIFDGCRHKNACLLE